MNRFRGRRAFPGGGPDFPFGLFITTEMNFWGESAAIRGGCGIEPIKWFDYFSIWRNLTAPALVDVGRRSRLKVTVR